LDFRKDLNSELVKHLPLSVTMTSGSPNVANTVLNSSITATEVAVFVWTASIDFEWASIKMRNTLFHRSDQHGLGVT